MIQRDSERQQLIEHTRRSYQDCYQSLKFPTPDISALAQRRRAEILDRLSAQSESCCGGTKLFSGTLSAGCTLCTESAWSCLFINGACDADCFFCPKTKDSPGPPTADGLVFSDVAEFVAYLRAVGSRGVGISGGEPLLKLNTTLEFITSIKREFGDSIHLWLYTNGRRATEESLNGLRNAGLDEIRFNIAGNRYELDAVRRATDIFGVVVVEIPTIPEDTERIKQLLPALSDLGVRCLNLHQLWCSPHSAKDLVERGYTFLHGSRVTVLESELAALEVLEHTTHSGITVPVHYCSATYKQRFQTAADLRRDARFVTRGHEDITEAGLIRQLSLSGSAADLTEQVRRIELAGGAPSDFRIDDAEQRLYFRTWLWNSVDFAKFAPRLQYDIAHRLSVG
ncbi:radical SAM protein, partial [Gemmatimonadota bacterium]